MENEQQAQDLNQQVPPQPMSYSVSTPTKQKSSNAKWLIIFIVLLILGGAGIFFFTKSASVVVPTPTPSFNVAPIENKATSTPVPTKSPEPVKKTDVSIEIQNGTGITGEAKLLSDKLKTLGYSDITVGNADKTDYTETVVTFSKTLSQTVQDEIKKELESFYKEVSLKTSSTQKSDIVIITGLRGSQTTKPVTSATPKATGSSVPAASASATPKVTATPTGI
jgi:hypothetical protein